MLKKNSLGHKVRQRYIENTLRIPRSDHFIRHTCTPVHSRKILNANHMPATQYIKACTHGKEVQLLLRQNNGDDMLFNSFDCVMIVGARWDALCISNTLLMSLDFHAELSLEWETKNIQWVVLWEVRWEWPSSLQEGDSNSKNQGDSNWNNHALQQWYAEEHNVKTQQVKPWTG